MSNYVPTYPGNEVTVEWLMSELSRIAASIDRTAAMIFEETFVAPESPKEGLLLFADGTLWNPGSGRGMYVRISGTWVKL